MDLRVLSQIPDSFFAETKKLYEQDQMDFFFQPHSFTVDGTKYSVTVLHRDLEILIEDLEFIPETLPHHYPYSARFYFESAKLIEEMCRKYPRYNPNMKWNNDFARQPGYIIPWQHSDLVPVLRSKKVTVPGPVNICSD